MAAPAEPPAEDKVIANAAVQGAASALGVEVVAAVSRRPPASTFKVRDRDGGVAALVVIDEAASEADRERFARVIAYLHSAEPIAGVQRVRAVAPSKDAFLTDLWTAGAARDLEALRWPLRHRVEFVAHVVQALQALHSHGMIHGGLSADNVLLDDQLNPVLSEVGWVSIPRLLARKADPSSYLDFAAPEVKEGGAPTVASDVHSAGKLLEAVVGTDDLPVANDVIKCCLAGSPSSRYQSAADLASALEPVIAAAPAERASELGQPPAERASKPGREKAPPPSRPSFAQTAKKPFPRTKAIAATLVVTVAATLVVMNPFAGWHPLRGSKLKGDPRAAAEDIMKSNRDFSAMSLAQVDLSGMDLTGANFSGADLSHANLTGAKLWAARIEGANLDGAVLAGAQMIQTTPGLAQHIDTAVCDAGTRMPLGWSCNGGRFAHAK